MIFCPFLLRQGYERLRRAKYIFTNFFTDKQIDTFPGEAHSSKNDILLLNKVINAAIYRKFGQERPLLI